MSASARFTCGLKSNGTLACWGVNDYGQTSPPVGLFKQVSAGVVHACAERVDGTLACWGYNVNGRAPRVDLAPAAPQTIRVNQPYSQAFSASGGTPPYTFTMAGGALPPGLSLAANGLLSGAPTSPGEYTFTIQAGDSFPGISFSGQATYSMTILNRAPSGGNGSITTPEDTSYAFTAASFPFSDPDGDALGGISLVSLPAAGELQCAGVAVQVGGLCADVTRLVFTPQSNTYGDDYASFTFYAVDPHGAASAAAYSMDIRVTPVNDRPLVDAGPDQTIVEGQAVRFSGAFTDPDLDPAGPAVIAWDFGDGEGAQGALDPQHVYPQDGRFTAALSVTDDLGEAGSALLAVTVTNAPPELSAVPDQEVLAGQPLAFTLRFSDAGRLDAHTVAVDWGDGQSETFALPAGVYELPLQHVYAGQGAYTAAITVRDQDGGQDSLAFQVTAAPVIRMLWLPVMANAQRP